MLAVLAAGLVLAPVTAAEPPFRVPDYVTDRAGVLSEGQRVQVENAVNQLYNDKRIRLWVVYVDSFSGQGAVNWAEQTARISDLGDDDALLAVATTDRAYAFVPTASARSTDADTLRRNNIEPALRQGDWTGAAVAAANGLNTPSTSTGPSTGSGFTWFGMLCRTGRLRPRASWRCGGGCAGAGASGVKPSSPRPSGWTRPTRTRWPRCRSTRSTISPRRSWSTSTTPCAPVTANWLWQ